MSDICMAAGTLRQCQAVACQPDKLHVVIVARVKALGTLICIVVHLLTTAEVLGGSVQLAQQQLACMAHPYSSTL